MPGVARALVGGRGSGLLRALRIARVSAEAVCARVRQVAYLLVYGDLPSAPELARWDEALMRHSAVPLAVEVCDCQFLCPGAAASWSVGAANACHSSARSIATLVSNREQYTKTSGVSCAKAPNARWAVAALPHLLFMGIKCC